MGVVINGERFGIGEIRFCPDGTLAGVHLNNNHLGPRVLTAIREHPDNAFVFRTR
jgi:hypothetical protein